MEFLEKLGFTQYQSKVIDALMHLNKGTAMQIAKKSKVPPNKVYQTIADLLEMDLVIETPKSPKEYSLSNIEEQLRKKIRAKEKEIYEVEDDYENFLRKYSNRQMSEEFWVLKDTDALLEKIEETYENLEKESVALIETWHARFSTLRATKFAIERGVKVRFIGKVDRESLPMVEKWLKVGVEIRHYDEANRAGFSVFDSKSVKISVQKDILKTIWSVNSDLAEILEKNFEVLWSISKPLSLENLEDFS